MCSRFLHLLEGARREHGVRGEDHLADGLEEFVAYLAEGIYCGRFCETKDKSFPERKPTSPAVEDEPEKTEAGAEDILLYPD
jgi:hypothetical protein